MLTRCDLALPPVLSRKPGINIQAAPETFIHFVGIRTCPARGTWIETGNATSKSEED